MKFLILIAVGLWFVFHSGKMAYQYSHKTIAQGNKQVAGNDQVIAPVDRTYARINSYFGRMAN